MSRINKSEVADVQQKIQQALDEDKPWLAREHYSSLIRVCGYDQEVYKKFADLLVLMREDLLAGKFYFLAGERSDQSSKCIALFMERYRRKKLGSIGSQFPKVAQRMDVQDFPEPIRSELLDWGYLGVSYKLRFEGESVKSSRLTNLLITIAIIALFLSIPVGIITMISWIISLFN